MFAAMALEPACRSLLDEHLHAARAAYPDVHVAGDRFADEVARRLGATGLDQLAAIRADHVYLAIACADGDPAAIRRLDDEFLGEVDACATRVNATRDQANDVRGQVRRLLFVSEPGRAAALRAFSGKGDLRSYVRVIATRELLRARDPGRRGMRPAGDLLHRPAPPARPPPG